MFARLAIFTLVVLVSRVNALSKGIKDLLDNAPEDYLSRGFWSMDVLAKYIATNITREEIFGKENTEGDEGRLP